MVYILCYSNDKYTHSLTHIQKRCNAQSGPLFNAFIYLSFLFPLFYLRSNNNVCFRIILFPYLFNSEANERLATPNKRKAKKKITWAQKSIENAEQMFNSKSNSNINNDYDEFIDRIDKMLHHQNIYLISYRIIVSSFLMITHYIWFLCFYFYLKHVFNFMYQKA